MNEPELLSVRFLAIGRVVKTQGRRGEILAEVLTDFPRRFDGVRRIYLGNGGEAENPVPAEVETTWPHKGRMVLKLSGVDSISDGERLVGRYILIPREERMPLAPNHYYVWELKGCRVITEREGRPSEVGIVIDVDRTGGVDLLRVERPNGRRDEVLVPLAREICKRIDTQAGIIVIDPPEDLLDLNS